MSVARVEETDAEEIAAQAYAEMDGKPLPEKKKPEESAVKPVEKQLTDEEAQPSEGQEVPEGQEGEKPAEETPGEEAKPAEAGKSDEDIIVDHATKNGMTYTEAKEDIEKTNAIIEKYKGNPSEMAKALRSTQSAYDKVKAQGEQKPQETVFQPMSDEQFIKEAKTHFSKDQDKHIDIYRSKYPNKSELMTDEAVLEDIIDRSLENYRSWSKEQMAVVKHKAGERREQLLNSIPENDKRFLPDVRNVLMNVNDMQVMKPDFDLKDLLFWSKGQRYDADIKNAEERGFKRAKEGAVIIGAKTGSDGVSKPKVSGQSSGTALTADQKSRATEMFSDLDGYTEEQAYKLFRETFAEELKKNPKFL